MKRTALDIPHPTTVGKTLWDARTDEGPFSGNGAVNMTVDEEFMSGYIAAKKEILASDIDISPLGSGSDYTAFLQRLGVCHLFSGFHRYLC
jgi:N-acetylated-alpha-linked acidic dipeptidase